jgi:hypothetical protein
MLCFFGTRTFTVNLLSYPTLPHQSEEHAYEKFGVAMEYLPNSWKFAETFQIFRYCICACERCWCIGRKIFSKPTS